MWGTLLLNAPVVVGAAWVSGWGLRLAPGVARWLGAFVVGWCWITVGVELLGSFGWLGLGPLAGWALGLLGLGAVCRWRAGERGAPSAHPSPQPSPTRGEGGGGGRAWAESATAAVAWAIVLMPCVALGVVSLFGPVKVVSDGPIYHLYFAIRWWKAGWLEAVPVPFGENAAPYFPAVGDVWFGWLVTGWGGDRLARVGQVPFLGLAAVATYAMARRLGAGRGAAAVAAGWFVTCTPLLLFSFEPNVDTIFVGGYLTAASFFLRAGLGEQERASWVVGALAAGLAWGTKPTGTVFVPPLLGLAAALIVGRRRPGWMGDMVAVAVLPLLGVGFWFGRNAWLTGNPLYPLDVPLLGWVGWYGAEVMQRGPYALPRGDVGALADIVLAVFDPRLMPFWLAALAGAWGGWRRDDAARDRWVWVASALAVGNVALYWVLIPYRTQQRFFLQAPGLAAVPLACMLDGGWGLRLAGLGLLAAHVFTGQGWPVAGAGDVPPWDFSPLIPGLARAVMPPAPGRAWAWGGLGVGCLAAAGAWVWWGRHPGWKRGAIAAGLLLGVVGGWAAWVVPPTWRTGVGGFYPPFPDFYRGWMALEQAAGPRGRRIAYAGTNIPYYLFGHDLRHEVRYVNVDRYRGWGLHDYHRAAIAAGRPHWPGYPRPGWDREGADDGAWLANLRAAGIELLAVTRVNVGEGPHNVADPEGFPIERGWADAHPGAFRLLYGEGDPWFRIYRVLPPVGADSGEKRTDRAAGSH